MTPGQMTVAATFSFKIHGLAASTKVPETENPPCDVGPSFILVVPSHRVTRLRSMCASYDSFEAARALRRPAAAREIQWYMACMHMSGKPN
ncbi:hypothetical protein CBOM_07733 [Ceraceosorus bombacis]|uniref:Uncharacterized protein n=1 Tax=Ceraceosorus bombacis TaxID=401625 RepID=A0A0P1B964_9BASI|nr:hypothetical protein CBOM_07733 [Ceraceosorus bombacis]